MNMITVIVEGGIERYDRYKGKIISKLFTKHLLNTWAKFLEK
jgi:hypothetical protein